MPPLPAALRPIRLTGGWRGVACLPGYNDFDPTDTSGPVLKDDGNSRVMLRNGLVIKRPALPTGTRRWLAPFRKPRAVRAWLKTLALQRIGLPVETPVLFARRGRDAIGVYRLVEGTTLADLDLDTLRNRGETFARIGRVLRQTARLGWTHLDAKSTNWIITPDERPVMIDCDGLRKAVFRARRRRGLECLLRALREHPQHELSDEAAVLRGFAGLP